MIRTLCCLLLLPVLLHGCASRSPSSTSLSSLPQAPSAPSAASAPANSDPPTAPRQRRDQKTSERSSDDAEAEQTSAASSSEGTEGKGSEASGGDAAPVPSENDSESARARTSEERKQVKEAAFARSLSEFDEMLLQEKETIRENRSGGADASTAGGGGGDSGSASGAAGASSGNASGREGGGTRAGSAQSQGGATGGTEAPGGDTSDRVPADIPDAAGDDIVARQLREAAVTEDDPVLRDKLWNEYRKYKGLPIPAKDKKI